MDLVKGTLDVVVLKALCFGPRHGYAVIRWIRERTGGELQVDDAALYQALHRMERRGWVRSEWGRSENNRRAKFYRITATGETELARQTAGLRRYTDALFQALEGTS